MKERLNSLLSEVGESFDYLKSDVRNLGRYLAELEELIESYRAFATTVTLSQASDQAALRKLLKRTRHPSLGHHRRSSKRHPARVRALRQRKMFLLW
ncbi:MAG TPA: hypothetical protein VFZ02_07285 [Ktedonobacteraceae bacterium]